MYRYSERGATVALLSGCRFRRHNGTKAVLPQFERKGERRRKFTKMAVFWVVAPCSLVEVYQSLRGPDGGSTDRWNAGKLISVYMALQARRQPSSYSPQ
jgi:hypothetical protein